MELKNEDMNIKNYSKMKFSLQPTKFIEFTKNRLLCIDNIRSIKDLSFSTYFLTNLNFEMRQYLKENNKDDKLKDYINILNKIDKLTYYDQISLKNEYLRENKKELKFHLNNIDINDIIGLTYSNNSENSENENLIIEKIIHQNEIIHLLMQITCFYINSYHILNNNLTETILNFDEFIIKKKYLKTNDSNNNSEDLNKNKQFKEMHAKLMLIQINDSFDIFSLNDFLEVYVEFLANMDKNKNSNIELSNNIMCDCINNNLDEKCYNNISVITFVIQLIVIVSLKQLYLLSINDNIDMISINLSLQLLLKIKKKLIHIDGIYALIIVIIKIFSFYFSTNFLKCLDLINVLEEKIGNVNIDILKMLAYGITYFFKKKIIKEMFVMCKRYGKIANSEKDISLIFFNSKMKSNIDIIYSSIFEISSHQNLNMFNKFGGYNFILSFLQYYEYYDRKSLENIIKEIELLSETINNNVNGSNNTENEIDDKIVNYDESNLDNYEFLIKRKNLVIKIDS